MKSLFSFKIYDTVRDIPAEWDILSKKNIFLSRDYLRILETAAPENMSCRFVTLLHEQEIIGICISQFLDLSQIPSFGERDHCLRTKIRNFVFKKFGSKVLIIGNNMLTGQNGIAFSKKVPRENTIKVLKQASNALELLYQKQGKKPHLTIFKDFSATQLKDFDTAEFDSFYRFSTQPNMIFDIKDSWETFDNYLADLNKKYRDQYKRARKKSDSLHKQKMSLSEIQKHKKEIHDLYMNVAKKAAFNTFYLGENHFEIFKKNLKDHFLFYGYFNENKLIGFNTLIKNGSDIDTYFLGYDEDCQKEKMLYLNMLYDMIGYSINKKYHRIIFARTALEIKSSVGAKAVAMFGLIRHNNPVLNLLVSKTFNYFEPKIAWQERNPFK
ncbi:Peptidogalycan biosysnthesis/recognition [Flavobacterium glycines]|uniref:8-amino-7-oxononanoate synthase n=2 Tax=Flavobacterium glycines TaxID=551990 RepID=A0A1B9DRE7_9FLAO|nr:peptidogalycan biosysnthesis protein [Flavobacterium glycines]OCB72253.1 8-amino-7-oxononanoate synthase [Flavobacterium glycines]SDI96390.1 Peptidogalycan biosysnthesis/recognition [Flavobacterium glycines]